MQATNIQVRDNDIDLNTGTGVKTSLEGEVSLTAGADGIIDATPLLRAYAGKKSSESSIITPDQLEAERALMNRRGFVGTLGKVALGAAAFSSAFRPENALADEPTVGPNLAKSYLINKERTDIGNYGQYGYNNGVSWVPSAPAICGAYWNSDGRPKEALGVKGVLWFRPTGFPVVPLTTSFEDERFGTHAAIWSKEQFQNANGHHFTGDIAQSPLRNHNEESGFYVRDEITYDGRTFQETFDVTTCFDTPVVIPPNSELVYSTFAVDDSVRNYIGHVISHDVPAGSMPSDTFLGADTPLDERVPGTSGVTKFSLLVRDIPITTKIVGGDIEIAWGRAGMQDFKIDVATELGGWTTGHLISYSETSHRFNMAELGPRAFFRLTPKNP